MKKRIFTIFLVILLAVTNMSVCYADGLDDLTNIGIDNYGETIKADFSGGKNNEDVPYTAPPTDYDEGNLWLTGIYKIIVNILDLILDGIYTGLLAIIEYWLPSMDMIVFNEEGNFWGRFFRLSYFDNSAVGLAGNLVSMVSAVYQVFRYVALIGFIIAIACIAVKMIISSVGKQKQQYKEALKNWLIGLVLLVVGHWIMLYLIYFSDNLVNVICGIKDSLIKLNEQSFLKDGVTFWNFWKDDATLLSAFRYAIDEMNSQAFGFSGIIIFILNTLMAIVGIIMFATLNFKIAKVYLERVIIVGVLIMLFPLVTVLYAFEKAGLRKGSSFSNWFKTYVEQVFVQPIHALALMLVVIVIIGMANTGIMNIPIVNMVFIIMAINMTFKIENIITKISAVSVEGLGKPINPAAAAGFAAAAAPGAIKGLGKLSKATGTGIAGLIGGSKNAIKNKKNGNPANWKGSVKGAYDNANKFLNNIDDKVKKSDFGRWNSRAANRIKVALGTDYMKNVVGGALSASGIHAPTIYGRKPGQGKKASDASTKELKLKIEMLKNTGTKEAYNAAQAEFDRYIRNFDADTINNVKQALHINKMHDVHDPAQMAAAIAYLRKPDDVHNIYDVAGNIDYTRAYDEAFNAAKAITGADIARYESPAFDINAIVDELKRLEHAYGAQMEKALNSALGGTGNTISNVVDLDQFLKVVYALEHQGASNVAGIDQSQIKKWMDNKAKN